MKRITMHYKKHFERLVAELHTPPHELAEEVLRLSLESHPIGDIPNLTDEVLCWHLGQAAKRLAKRYTYHLRELDTWLFALHHEWCSRGRPEPRHIDEKPMCPW